MIQVVFVTVDETVSWLTQICLIQGTFKCVRFRVSIMVSS